MVEASDIGRKVVEAVFPFSHFFYCTASREMYVQFLAWLSKVSETFGEEIVGILPTAMESEAQVSRLFGQK